MSCSQQVVDKDTFYMAVVANQKQNFKEEDKNTTRGLEHV